jgi:zinc protease
MIRPFRPAFAALAGLALLLSASAIASAAAPPPLAERDRVWTQDYSDLKPDAAVRFGTLPNGMRYALMHNATPPGQASVRLRFGTGSLQETDAQQGLAHYLEHLAFAGSTNVPKNEMVRILERNGLSFGGDTNASTDWTETVYRLDLPNTSATVVDTALMLMSEVASELSIAKEGVDQERGIVLSEERARDTPPYRAYKQRLEFILKGQLAPRRLPIGTVDVLRSAQRDQLKAYYDAYYRPERATLIMVGDFDPAAIEAKVKARFSTWRARTPKPSEPDLGAHARRGPEVKLVVEPGGSLNIQLAWVSALDTAPDTEAKRRSDMIDYVAQAVLNRRLDRQARGDNPPFLGAGAGRNDEVRSATVTTLSINADPAGWRTALIAAEETRRRLLQFGASQAEVDREVLEFRTSLRAQANASATRRTPALANELLQTVDEGLVFTTPQEDLALFERAVAGLTASRVDAALKAIFQGEGPLLFMASPMPVEGGEPALAAALREAQSSTLTAPTAAVAKTWTHTSFGAPGPVAETRVVSDLGVTFVRFANGVRLTVKPTKFRDEQILVNVRFGHGTLELPKGAAPPWSLGSAFIQGGLADLTLEEIEAVFADRVVGIDMGVGEEAFSLSGSTRPADLDIQLQVLAAYMTQPGWRPEGFQRMRTYGLTLHRQLEATPQGVLRRDLEELTHSGDRRWRMPSQAEIEAGRPDDVRRVLQRPLADGPIEVVISGDVTVERAIQVVAATFGALPARGAYPPPSAEAKAVRFPAAASVVRTHTGRDDQAVAYMAWPTVDFASAPQTGRELRMLQLVMGLRLIDQIRVAQGATYSPSTGWEASTVFPGYGYVSASVEIPPPLIPGFFADVGKIAADLRDKAIGADELDRARKSRIEAIERSKQTNEYWLGQLAGAQEDPRRLDYIRDSVPGLERVTPADIQRVARQYLLDEKVWRITVQKQ